MEIQQSDLYIQYVRKLGWDITRTDNVYILHRNIPFFGAMAKIQRSDSLPHIKTLSEFLSHNKIRTLALEPDMTVEQNVLSSYIRSLQSRVRIRINQSPFLPTKTIRVDLQATEDLIFSSFSEAKRRAVRRALRYGITVHPTDTVDELIRVKNKSAGLFGSITTYGLREMWDTLGPQNRDVVLAYAPYEKEPLAGIYLVFFRDTCFYWIAGSVKKGKRMFAPTLLVWEAMKLAKIRGALLFDFVGVWDERIPHYNPEWHGFTKFKEGFGGTVYYYPIASL